MSAPTNQNHHQSSTAPTPPAETTPPRSKSQRVFTEGDEIRLLKWLLKSSKGPNQNQTCSDLDLVKTSLNNEFTNDQLTAKLRRLRIKYRKQARTKSLIKTPHDRRLFEISQKIWGKKKPNPPNKPPQQQQNHQEEDHNVQGEELFGNVVMAAREEEGELAEEQQRERKDVGLAELPMLVAEMSRAFPGNEVWREGLKGLDEGKLREMNEEWRKLQIEETKLMAKRAQLIQQHVQLILEALGSSSSS